MARVVTVLLAGVTAKPNAGAGCYGVTLLRKAPICVCVCMQAHTYAGGCVCAMCL